ncbi:MAG TPA: zf-TFIIB domain-containing protein [Pyrinomonadaceae bacterium]|nr:zf-TFIIB domain-containing protein [Pyrinomonadaceae bacterium]
MADDQSCFRCGKRQEGEQLASSVEGNKFCPECWVKVNAVGEGSRKCPVDGVDMIKRRVADAVVIDTCQKCGGLWFDKGELEIIERKSRDMGWQSGFFTSIMLL